MSRGVFIRLLLAAALVLTASAARTDSGQDWRNWRGPHFDGSSDETNLPVKFSATEGVKWSTPLPGPSAGTPIICGDSVFVSSTDPKNQTLLAICVDRNTGAVRWSHVAGTGYQPAGRGTPISLDDRSNYASPSPVTDGRRVVFFYGSGDMVAYDFAGKRLWARNVQQDYGDFCFNWTFASTPQFYEGRLYMQILQRDMPVGGRGREGQPSWLIALDPNTGRELWKAVRPTDARFESREAYSTPIPYVHNGRKEILISGGDILTGHDAATGKELWRWGTWNPNHLDRAYRLVPSPVAGAGVVLGCGPKRAPVFAVKLGLNGDVSETGLAWRSEDRSQITTDVPTPLFYRGRFYVQSDVRKALTCLQPADGKIVWSIPLPGLAMCWSSPTGADGKIYTMSLAGDVYVVDAKDGTILAANKIADGENELRSSIAVAHGNLFIRTNSRLLCIGN